MYWPRPIKLLCSATGLVVILLLGGCPSAPVVDTKPFQTQPVVSHEIDTAAYHTVQRGETLAAIAQRFGRNYFDIARWNNIPPPYTISIGQILRVNNPGYDNVTPPMPQAGIPVVTPAPPESTPIVTPPVFEQDIDGIHTVQAGETLFAIAGRYGHKFQEVAAWNNIVSPYHLRVGQVLKLSPPDDWDPTKPVSKPPARKPPVTKPPAKPPTRPTPSPTPKNRDYHIVLAGETLFKIAKHYRFSMVDVAAWNGLQAPYNLSIGQKLRLSLPANGELPVPPKSTPPSFESPVKNETGYHIVVIGDTLYRLSKHYGHSVADLAAWNNLSSPYDLSLGQKLRLTKPTTMMPGLTPDNRNLRSVGLHSSSGYHIVKGGETLAGIAKKYGVSLSELADWNGIGSPYTVYPGLKLTIIPD